MKFFILFFILLSFIIFLWLRLSQTTKPIHNKHSNTKNICTGYLTDKEYLEHMIPHHQVAIDISIELQKKTKWPKMQQILRKLIWTQQFEILLMKDFLYSHNHNFVMNDNITFFNYYTPTTSDYIKPNTLGLSHTFCDPNFFDPVNHMKHLNNMVLTDTMYIHHMIPHHQVAVDMSKVLLTNTHNVFMIHLANRIIKSQQEEIILLNQLLSQPNFKPSSNLLF